MRIIAPNGLVMAHVEIPRTGSSSLRKALRNNGARHIPAIEQRKQIGIGAWKNLYSYSTVRHPFERVVSQYLHEANPEKRFFNFEDYVILRYYNEYRSDLSHREHQRLWWPNWKWLTDYHGRIIVSEWMRFEDAPWNMLRDYFGINKMPHEARATNRRGNWQGYHTTITRSIIEEHSKRDFELFYPGG